MLGFKCIFVEKKDGFNVEAKSLMEDFKSNLRIENLQAVRVYIRWNERGILSKIFIYNICWKDSR